MDIGIARSDDGGNHWNLSTVPFNVCNGGIVQELADVFLTYSSDGKTLYLSATAESVTPDPSSPNQQGITATLSKDKGITVILSKDNGKTWSNPRWLILDTDFSFASSITADPLNHDTVYVAWKTFAPLGRLFFSKTIDGGKSWSNFASIFNPTLQYGPSASADTPKLVILKNGDILSFMNITMPHKKQWQGPSGDIIPDQQLALVRSINGGASWDSVPTFIASNSKFVIHTCGPVEGPCNTQQTYGRYSVALNPKTGALYVVYGQQLPPLNNGVVPAIILLVVSRDNGYTWSKPVQVNRTPISAPNPQAFTTSIAVNDEGHVGVQYYDFRNSLVASATATKTDIWLAFYEDLCSPSGGSTGLGLNFLNEVRLNDESYSMENGPASRFGFFTNGPADRLVAQSSNFYSIAIQSLHGLFTPPDIVTTANGPVTIDTNKRSAPFFRKVKIVASK